MSGYCYCGLTFMALLSPSVGLAIDHCSLQARGHRVRMSGREWPGWRLELLGGVKQHPCMKPTDEKHDVNQII